MQRQRQAQRDAADGEPGIVELPPRLCKAGGKFGQQGNVDGVLKTAKVDAVKTDCGALADDSVEVPFRTSQGGEADFHK